MRELRAALPEWTIEPLDADGYPDETGDTYEENARGKARYGRDLTPPDLWVIGEDAGIFVGQCREQRCALDGRECQPRRLIGGQAERRTGIGHRIDETEQEGRAAARKLAPPEACHRRSALLHEFQRC